MYNHVLYSYSFIMFLLLHITLTMKFYELCPLFHAFKLHYKVNHNNDDDDVVDDPEKHCYVLYIAISMYMYYYDNKNFYCLIVTIVNRYNRSRKQNVHKFKRKKKIYKVKVI